MATSDGDEDAECVMASSDGDEDAECVMAASSPTSWPSSMEQSLADWTLASTMTLNMVQMDCGTRKSVERLLLWSFTSNAARVLQNTQKIQSNLIYIASITMQIVSRFFPEIQIRTTEQISLTKVIILNPNQKKNGR